MGDLKAPVTRVTETIKNPNLKTTRSTSNGPDEKQRIQRKNRLILWKANWKKLNKKSKTQIADTN
jgi:hypothetical protein